MAVILNKANLVLKDANGNIGKIEQLSSNDLAKIKTAVSDVALVVNQSNHTPIEATTTNKGVVQLATSVDVASGAIDKVVTAEQLHNATTGTSALAAENLARIDAVVTEAGISVDHTNTNQLKTAVITLVNNAVPSTATSTTLGVVKPDNDTIKIDSSGVLTATAQMPGVATTSTVGVVKPDGSTITVDGDGTLTAIRADSATSATQDSAGNVITNTYVKKTGDETISGVKTFTDTINANGFIGFNSTRDGFGGGFANYLNNNKVCDVWGQPSGADKSSYIHLRIKDYGTDNNLAYLAIEGNNQTKQGSIAFNGKNLVRSVNGVNANANGNVPLGNLIAIPGTIEWFAFNIPPDGYLVCNGATVSRETYANLFASIGTTFGKGDGSTTFTLPDLRDRYIIGANTNALGAYIAEQLPNIRGVSGGTMNVGTSGAFYKSGATYSVGPGGYGFNQTSMNARAYNSTYQDNGHVYPKSLALLPCIKY